MPELCADRPEPSNRLTHIKKEARALKSNLLITINIIEGTFVKTPLKNQAIKFLATGFGSGLSPVAPGTCGTLVGVAVCASSSFLPGLFRLLFILAVAIGSVYIAGQAERLYGKKDDGRIVIDEIAGFQVAMAALPVTCVYLCLAFVLFRIFDIWKPLGINRLQSLPGGWGVVADDLGAGVYAAVILFFFHLTGVI